MENEIKVEERINSVKISISTKGVFSGECKCYAKTSEEALILSIKRADELERYLVEKNKNKF